MCSQAIRIGLVSIAFVFSVVLSAAGALPADVNGDGTVDALDVQLVVNGALGIETGMDCDVDRQAGVDAVDVQLTINAALGIDIGVYVPDVARLTQDEAETQIVDADLAVGPVTEEYSETVSASRVMTQEPAAGRLVARHTGVTLTVSLGPEPTTGVIPVILVTEGNEVTPQTTLHLDGTHSHSSEGAITAYEWGVTQPDGSQSVFDPSISSANPTFEANVAGTYVFSLHVWDETSTRSTLPAHATVQVVPDQTIHIELLWRTPADPDETDTGPEAGSDLDLHFTHPNAPSGNAEDLDGDGLPDPYFDIPYDCFWFNPTPDWGQAGSTNGDPALERDDTDGAGPENLNVRNPESGKDYLVAVHYWNDHYYGDAFATVRVYINGVLAFEDGEVQLTKRDLWRVATIHWPSGTVTSARNPDNSPHITPDYAPADFYAP